MTTSFTTKKKKFDDWFYSLPELEQKKRAMTLNDRYYNIFSKWNLIQDYVDISIADSLVLRKRHKIISRQLLYVHGRSTLDSIIRKLKKPLQ